MALCKGKNHKSEGTSNKEKEDDSGDDKEDG